jgi:hypothetical protein
MENENNEDIYLKINLIRNIYKRTFKKFELENKNEKNNLNEHSNNLIDDKISSQILKKFQYKIKRNYKELKPLSLQVGNEEKNISKYNFYKQLTDYKEPLSTKHKIFFEKKKDLNKFSMLKKTLSISNIFGPNESTSSSLKAKLLNANKTPKLSGILKNPSFKNTTVFNKYISKKIQGKRSNTNSKADTLNSSFDYLGDYSIKAIYFNKLKLKLRSHTFFKKDLKKPLFFEQLEIMKRKDNTEIFRKKKRKYNNEKYTQMFNFQDIIFEDKSDIGFDLNKQIISAKQTCDLIIFKFNSLINKDDHIMNLDKFGI